MPLTMAKIDNLGNKNNYSEHTATTVSMSPCSVSGKVENCPIKLMRDFADESMKEEEISTREQHVDCGILSIDAATKSASQVCAEGYQIVIRPSHSGAGIQTPSEESAALLKHEVNNDQDPLLSGFVSPASTPQPCKMRKTLSTSAMEMLASQRWSSDDLSSPASRNKDWGAKALDNCGRSLPKPMRRGDWGESSSDYPNPNFESSSMGRCVSSTDARRGSSRQSGLNRSDMKTTNASFLEPPLSPSDKAYRGSDSKSCLSAVKRKVTPKALMEEEDELRMQLAELYGQAEAMTSLTKSQSLGANIPVDSAAASASSMSGRRSYNTSRQAMSNLQSIEEDGLDTSVRGGGNAAWKVGNAQRSSDTSSRDVLQSPAGGSVGSRSSTSSNSLSLSSVFGPSPTQSNTRRMPQNYPHTGTKASVFSNKGLTPEQQAKLMELQKLAASHTPVSRSFGAASPAMSNMLITPQFGLGTVSIPHQASHLPSGRRTAGTNMFAQFLPTPQYPTSPDIPDAPTTDMEMGSPQLSERRAGGSRGSKTNLAAGPPLSPRKSSSDERFDVLQKGTARQSVVAKKKMPFGYKAKSTDGLFGASKSPPSSSSQLQGNKSNPRPTVESGRRGTSATKGLTRTHSWLESAPVSGEQLETMKALMLGQEVPSPSSSKKLSRSQHGSTPILSELDHQRSSRRDSAKNAARKMSPLQSAGEPLIRRVSASTNALGSTTSSRWQPAPIPQNSRWDADADAETMLPLKDACLGNPDIPIANLSRRRSGDQISSPTGSKRLPPCRWSSGGLQEGVKRSSSGIFNAAAPGVTSPEAVALSALMRGQEDKRTSVKMTRGNGTSSGRLQANLGQLKRSRLSLASMKQENSEQESITKGGLNSTWKIQPERVAISSSIAMGDVLLDSPSDKRNMFASIISPSSDRGSITSGSSHRDAPSTKSLPVDLDSKLMANLAKRNTSIRRFQSASLVDMMAVAPRKKSDLKQIVLGAGDFDSKIRKARSNINLI